MGKERIEGFALAMSAAKQVTIHSGRFSDTTATAPRTGDEGAARHPIFLAKLGEQVYT